MNKTSLTFASAARINLSAPKICISSQTPIMDAISLKFALRHKQRGIKMNQVNENRKHLLTFLNLFKEAVEVATDLEGEWKIEKPSLTPVYVGTPYAGWQGGGHTRYTLTVDLSDPRGLSTKANKDE